MVNVSQIYSLNGEKSTVDYYIPAGLTSLRIYGESVIGYGAFSDITSLTNLVINDNDITAIGDYAFYNCSHLTNLVYTNDDYEIVNHVMTIKSKDYNINLMPGIITIGNYAFYGCSNIESIRMEGNVTTIGDYAFAKCTTLARINNTLDSARATILADKTYTYKSVEYQGSEDIIYDLNILDGVTSIGTYAFDSNLYQYVRIPNSVTYMGQALFANMPNIIVLSIPFVGRKNPKADRSDELTQSQINTIAYMFGREAYDGGYKVDQIKDGADYSNRANFAGNISYLPTSLTTLLITNAMVLNVMR